LSSGFTSISEDVTSSEGDDLRLNGRSNRITPYVHLGQIGFLFLTIPHRFAFGAPRGVVLEVDPWEGEDSDLSSGDESDDDDEYASSSSLSDEEILLLLPPGECAGWKLRASE
jgi:hypothetical protein